MRKVREREFPVRRPRKRAHREERRERLAPRVVRALALVGGGACCRRGDRLGGRGWVSAVAGERLSPAAKDAATILLFTVVLPVAVGALVVVVISLLGGKERRRMRGAAGA